MWNKIWATYWGIALGYALVQMIFHSKQEFLWVSVLIYGFAFLATLFEIKMGQSLLVWLYRRHKKRQAERADPNNWSV
jgi:hypothetical protein